MSARPRGAGGSGERKGPTARLVLFGIGLGLVGISIFGWLEHTSLERANRLYRAGDREAAIEIYERRIAGERSSPVARYNLGTALVGADPRRGASLLAEVAEEEGSEAVQPSHYNLGVRSLLAAERAVDSDSTRILLFDAVEHSRAALRLDPSDGDARWNLALAERRLLEIFEGMDEAERRNAQTDDDEFVVDDPSLTRSEEAEGVSGREPEEPQGAERIGERQGAREGAQEAWATQDPGPLSATEALGLLERAQDDPETMIRGFLWAHRPDVAWWDDQPYPGGEW